MTQLPNKRYVHTEGCLDIHKVREHIRKEESKQWSELYEYIKEFFGLIDVPPRNIKRLHELRDGFDIVEGKRVKRYKQGAEYSLMLESFQLQEEKIKWFIRDILNDGKDASDINKCISMMLNGLNTAWKNRQDKAKKENDIKKELSISVDNDMSLDIEPVRTKRKKDDRNIAHLL